MGLFDCMCCESGLIIDDKQRLIVIVEATKGDRWLPLALPIAGTNDRGGTMDVPSRMDANMSAVVTFGKTLSYEDDSVKASNVDLEAMLDEIRADGSGARWGTAKRRVSFALIEGGVFSAIVKAVATNGATAWKRYAQFGLGLGLGFGLGTSEPPLPNRKAIKVKASPIDATTRRLCEAILATPDDVAPRKVYIDHLLERDDPRGRLLSLLPAIEKLELDVLAQLALPGGPTAVYGKTTVSTKLRPALVELARFLAWGTALVPAIGEGQFSSYDDEDGGVAPYVVRARKNYAGMPELLAAVDANAKAWRKRT